MLVVHLYDYVHFKCFKNKHSLKQENNSGFISGDVEMYIGVDGKTCMLCHKSFTCRANLTRHIVVHTGARPYACEICNKRFNVKANLKTHMGTHIRM